MRAFGFSVPRLAAAAPGRRLARDPMEDAGSAPGQQRAAASHAAARKAPRTPRRRLAAEHGKEKLGVTRMLTAGE
jgi:hypothetical protein